MKNHGATSDRRVAHEQRAGTSSWEFVSADKKSTPALRQSQGHVALLATLALIIELAAALGATAAFAGFDQLRTRPDRHATS